MHKETTMLILKKIYISNKTVNLQREISSSQTDSIDRRRSTSDGIGIARIMHLSAIDGKVTKQISNDIKLPLENLLPSLP